MPSGAKRRKAAAAAAKKKKEQEEAPAGSEAGSFNGGEELKGQESDGGEAGLQSEGQSFSEGGGGDSGSSLVRTNESEKGGVEEVVLDEEVEVVKVDSDEAGVEITREVETVDVLGSRDIGFEVGKTGGGSSRSSSSSSSSDDEKIDAEVTEVVVPVSIEVEQVYEMVESVVDPPVPGLAVEEVVVVSEASPVEDPYEDLDVLPGAKATTEAVLPILAAASESLGESSNVDSSVVKDAEVKVFPPSDSPVDVTRNGARHLKDQEIQDPVENQTSRPQVPLSVQRTSWKGCCGLFEVFTGSR